MATLRKVLIGEAANNLWSTVLRQVKTHAGLHDGLEAALRREIEADSNNWSAKSKLKLLKIVKHLCCDGADVQMIIMFTVLSFVDAAVVKILVDRVTLAELVDLIAKGLGSTDLAAAFLDERPRHFPERGGRCVGSRLHIPNYRQFV